MSGELAKKLGKTHIGDALDVKNSSSAPTDDDGIAIQLHSYPRPGILIVTLHEGVGFSPPDQHKQTFNKHQHDSLGRHDKLKTLHFRHPVYHQPFLPYAILDFDKSQVFIGADSGTTENPLWAGDKASSCRFDVSGLAELTVYLYLKNTDASKGSQDIFLGLTRIHPSFDEQMPLDPEWLNVQDGTGKIRVTVEYIENRTSKMANWEYLGNIGESSSGTVEQVKKEDTRQLYAEKTIRTADVSLSEVVRTLRTQIDNPFITSLRLACRSPWGLHLFSPFVSGGHLFYYLQKERRFDVTRSAFYTAELLCALEYLHNVDIVCNRLRPRNILLDSLGHIALCDFGLFNLEIKDTAVEIPAPELLIGQTYSRAADWWTLGVFLYEMLTGLPPFYDENTDEMHRMILHEPVQFPKSLPPAAKDILTELLNRKPEKRLGANGAAEVKARVFFCDLDWDKLLQRKYEPTFKPDNVAMCFEEYPILPVQQFSGFTYNQPEVTLEDLRTDRNASTKAPSPPYEPSQEATKEENGWVLRWDEASQSFHFYNRFTNTKRPANVQATNTTANGTEAPTIQQPSAIQPIVRDHPTIHGDSSPTIGSLESLPSQRQKREVLEAALKAGYHHIVSQLMEYDMDLNIEIFGSQQISPLKWAVEHENVDLVKLFLNKGADANFPNCAVRNIYEGGPALIKAVKKGNQELTEILVQKTDRVASTRALGLAIDRQDIAMVRLLLINGVQCDFEEADRPHPRRSLDITHCYRNSEPEEFIPPLVRAVRQGNVDLTRLMLLHGADANIGYHDLQGPEDIMFSCGRVIELAMELKHQEIVQLLLAGGADIGLVPPVWPVPGHDCPQVPRTIYQRVTAGLRVAAARK